MPTELDVMELLAEWYERGNPDPENGEFAVYHVRQFTDGTILHQFIGHGRRESE
jgi:hypothetical protein